MLPGIVQNPANRTLAYVLGYFNVLLVLMLHPAREQEPTANPARFSRRRTTVRALDSIGRNIGLR